MANLLDMHIAVSNGVIDVSMGGVSASIPVEQLEAFARVVEAMRLLVGAADGVPAVAKPPVVAAPAVVAATPAPRMVQKASEPVASPPVASPPVASTRVARLRVAEAPAVAPAADEAADEQPKRKRRSRKRVGDALVAWMSDSPGWHSEEKLLQIVTERKMSDASPKRALKIALGKQRDIVFASDGQGNWKLVGDDTPPSKPSRRRKQAAAKGGKKKRLRAKKAAVAPAPEPEVAAADEPKVRTVLVKRGEDRKSATMSDGELEAREAASAKLQPLAKGRWQRASADEVARARRNLLGLGGPSADG